MPCDSTGANLRRNHLWLTCGSHSDSACTPRQPLGETAVQPVTQGNPFMSTFTLARPPSKPVTRLGEDDAGAC
jgi:hypothetical protein